MSDVDFYVKAINGRVSELRGSAWLPKFLDQLDSVTSESSNLAAPEPHAQEPVEDQEPAVETPSVRRIRCLALGSFTEFVNPRFQLALLLIMAEHLKVKEISAWDPIFNEDDKKVLERFGIVVTDRDFAEGALWYVPHGPFSLVVDLPLKIGQDIYIGNDLSVFDLDNRDKQEAIEAYKQNADIRRLQTSRQDRWFEAFSSTAIHRRRSN